jgi:hypothetical protein
MSGEKFDIYLGNRLIGSTTTQEAANAVRRLISIGDIVDRSARCVIGEALAPGVPNTELKDDGQQKGYVILCDEERAKGFVRPVRYSYTHLQCGFHTTMSEKLAETYARDPNFYDGTFCSHCGGHFLVGQDGEFVWKGTQEKVGT